MDDKSKNVQRADEVLTKRSPSRGVPPSQPRKSSVPIGFPLQPIVAGLVGAVIILIVLGLVGFAEKFGGFTMAIATILGGLMSALIVAFNEK